MPGFFVANVDGKNEYRRETIKKFENDKTLCEYGCGDVAILEGVLLNKKALFKQTDTSDVNSLIFGLYRKGEDFFNIFRGSFSGAYFDKQKNRWIIYTNHTGDGAVYYYCSEGILIAASDPAWIIGKMKELGISRSIDETAVYYMLTYGYLADESTYCNEIKRLLPGQYLIFAVGSGKCEIKTYYQIKMGKLSLENISEDEAVDKIEAIFTEAVRMQFDKDIEYGYRHFCELSGGLDSRMVYWVAHELGYTDILTFTFGQSGCLDETVARQMSNNWNEETIVMPSDSARFLRDSSTIVRTNFGTSLYYGSQMQERILGMLDFEKFGMIHGGLIGGEIAESVYANLKQVGQKKKPKAYSGFLVGEYEDKSDDRYGNSEEQFVMMVALMAGCSSALIAREYSVIYSPYMNPDYIDLILSFPTEWRINRRIVRKWIVRKHPEATKFKWATKNLMIKESDFDMKIRRSFAKLDWIRRNPQIILKKLGITYKARPQKHGRREGMSPIDTWYYEVLDNKVAMDERYKTLNDKISAHLPKKLASDIDRQYSEGRATEKGLVITALEGLNYYEFG